MSTGEPPTLFKSSYFDFEDFAEGNYIQGRERYTFGGIGYASQRKLGLEKDQKFLLKERVIHKPRGHFY